MELLEPRTRARRYSWVTERSARSGQPQAPPDPKYRDLVLTEKRMHAERVTKARRRRATRRIRLGRPSSIRSRPTDRISLAEAGSERWSAKGSADSPLVVEKMPR